MTFAALVLSVSLAVELQSVVCRRGWLYERYKVATVIQYQEKPPQKISRLKTIRSNKRCYNI